MNKFLLITIIFFTAIAASQADAQQVEHRGIQLYNEGKNAEAVSLLSLAVKQKEFEKNAEIWNFLGLAYFKVSDFKKARKALEKAVKLDAASSIYHSNLAFVYFMLRETGKARSEAKKALELDPKNVTAYYLRGSASLWDNKLNDAEKDADQIIVIDPAYPQGYVLKSNVLIAKLGQRVAGGSTPRDEIKYLKVATEILKNGVEKCKDNPNHKLVDDELESVEAFYVYFSKDKPASTTPTDPDPSVTPLKVIAKPRPSYTNSARQSNVQGTIKMAVLFGANGKVQHLLLFNRLGNGLDEQAMIAAFKINFEPMKKDGKPVSTVRVVEYSFSIF